MPLLGREKSSLKGRWRLKTVWDMRSSGSNPVSCSETSIKIYGSKEEIRARKSPETVDAPGFAPDASIPITLYDAERGTWTLMVSLPHGPEPCASANSATSAHCGRWDLNPHEHTPTRSLVLPVCQFQHSRLLLFIFACRVSHSLTKLSIAQALRECKHFFVFFIFFYLF